MSANECRFLFEDTGIGHLKERIYNLSDGHFDKSARMNNRINMTLKGGTDGT